MATFAKNAASSRLSCVAVPLRANALRTGVIRASQRFVYEYVLFGTQPLYDGVNIAKNVVSPLGRSLSRKGQAAPGAGTQPEKGAQKYGLTTGSVFVVSKSAT